MTRFWPLTPSPAVGRARWPMILVIALAVVAPVLIVLALAPRTSGDAVPAAIVNLDVPIQDGDSTVAAGKLLTQNLVTADDDISWTLTDADTASSGLADGTFQAVVTIPADFSQTVSRISTDDPAVSTLAVQTSTEHGYVGGVVAEAVAVGLPADVSQELTEEYVAGTLAAFAELHDGLSDLATGVDGLQEGTDAATEGAEELATDAQLLADGLAEIDRVIDALPAGAADLGTLSADGAAASARLAESLAASAVVLAELAVEQSLGADALGALEDAVRADPTAPAGDLLDDIAALQQGAASVESGIADQSRAIAADAADAAVIAVGAEGIALISGPVAQGLGTLAALTDDAAAGSVGLAEGVAALDEGLEQLGAATEEVASGTQEIASSVPDYSDDQQKEIGRGPADHLERRDGRRAAECARRHTGRGRPDLALAGRDGDLHRGRTVLALAGVHVAIAGADRDGRSAGRDRRGSRSGGAGLDRDGPPGGDPGETSRRVRSDPGRRDRVRARPSGARGPPRPHRIGPVGGRPRTAARRIGNTRRRGARPDGGPPPAECRAAGR